MKAIFDRDRVSAFGYGLDGGIEIPNSLVALNPRRWVFDGSKVVDATSISYWMIDDIGEKHLPSMNESEAWPVLDCDWSDELIKDGDGWRVKTDEDRQQEEIEKANAEFISELRRQIKENVADTESLLGTVSDATGLLIAIALADVVALSSKTSFADYRKAKLDTLKLLAGDADIATLSGGALAQIQSGDVVLTASLKGLNNVITESLTRSTQVAEIISNKSQQVE